MSELIDKERLWKDVKRFVEKRLHENKTEMYTNARKKRFWLKNATDSYIRIEREDSERDKEDIPKQDFIDIWNDLHHPKYSSSGYMIKDLQGGNNWHSSVTFTLISKLPYIELKKIGGGTRYFLKQEYIEPPKGLLKND